MKPIMFYDTETSGLPLFKEPSSDPRQPHIVQAAALLVDEDSRSIISSFDLIAKPDGWEIPAAVTEIHGISTEHALAVGVPERQIVSALWAFACIASKRIAHVESFDARIVRIALKRFVDDDTADLWKCHNTECTALMATPIMKMASTAAMKATGRGNQRKKPKLAEAYEFFTGAPLDGAHSAMADAIGCMAVYFAIKQGRRAGE